MSHAAELSIVVVATNRLQVMACVEALAARAALDRAEIVVVATADCSLLQERVPRVRLIPVGAAWTMSRMRAEGLRVASGRWAALLSEDYRVGDDWVQAVLSISEQADVLVGEVLPPDKGSFARAAYLWEYFHVAHPAAEGELSREQARRAPAGAVVYRMRALDIDSLKEAHSEMEYHEALFASGRRFYRDPRIRVRYAPPVHGFLSDRLWRSREWARSRSTAMSLPLRWLAAASRIALPAVLLGRFVVRGAMRPRYGVWALTALPFALLFAAAETLGEVEGYVGRPR